MRKNGKTFSSVLYSFPHVGKELKQTWCSNMIFWDKEMMLGYKATDTNLRILLLEIKMNDKGFLATTVNSPNTGKKTAKLN